MCSDAVLDDIGELRLHLRLKTLTDATLATYPSVITTYYDSQGPAKSRSGGHPASEGPDCVFKAPVEIAEDGWSRIELSITGMMATLKFNGQAVGDTAFTSIIVCTPALVYSYRSFMAYSGAGAAGGIDVSGPKTAPGGTKSYLPKSGFASLGGGPDYSTTLSFDNFTVGAPATGGPGGSICGGAAPAASMAVVGVACGLDVPGLAFDIVGQRIMPRSDHSLCVTDANSTLILQKCAAGQDAAQNFVYNRALATIVLASAPPPAHSSPWDRFTLGQGVPYGKQYTAVSGDTLTAVRHLSKNHASNKQSTACGYWSLSLIDMSVCADRPRRLIRKSHWSS